MSKKDEKIKLEDIYLATQNPRIADVKYNMDGKFFRDSQKNDDLETMKSILSYEGNFNNLLELFKSISEEYNEMLEKPYVIENEPNEKIVIEGNRRIMVLKCLHSLIQFPKFSDLININESDEDNDLNLNINQDDEDLNPKKRRRNIVEINKTIKEFTKRDKNIKISVQKIERNENEKAEISVAIFTNHVTGIKKGKKNWNRGKTLGMYMNFWETIDLKDDKKKIKQISAKLNRSEKDVKDNLKSASWIRYLLEKSNEDKEAFFKKRKISSLEKQFVQKFINFKKKTRWEDEIKLEQNINFEQIKLKSNNNSFSEEELAKFIIDSYKKHYFNTRGIKADLTKKEKFEILSKISIFFKESEKIEDEDYKLQINELKNKNMMYLIENKNKFERKDVKEYIDFVSKNINLSNEIKLKKFEVEYDSPWTKDKKLKPFNTIMENLAYQYTILVDENEIKNFNTFPINAIMSTLRSIIENFCYFLMYHKPLFENLKNSKYISNWFEQAKLKINPNAILNFESLLLNKHQDQLQKIYSFLRKKHLKKNIKKNILNSIQEIFKNKSISNIKNFNIIFSHNTFKESSKIIHSPYLLFLEDNNDEIIKFKKNYELLKLIILLFKEIKIIQ